MVRPRSRRRVLLAGGAALTAALAGCTDGTMTDEPPAGEDEETDTAGEDDDAAASGDAVEVVTVGPDGEPRFDPEQVQVERGSTVRWEWASDGHTVTALQSPSGTGWTGEQEQQDEGHTHEERFDVVGTYEYQCDTHADEGMVGSIVVEETGE